MIACHSCGVALCGCPDLRFAGLAPASSHNPEPDRVAAAGHGLSDRPGCNSDQIPFHEVCNNDRA